MERAQKMKLCGIAMSLAACGDVKPLTDAAGGGGNDDAAIDAPGPANLTVAPLTHQFGPVPVPGASAPFTFTFTNPGGRPATGCGAAQKGGAHATDFDITGDTCGTTDLQMGASCTVQVTAKPTVAGARTLTLSRVCAAGGTASTTPDAIVVNEPMYAFVTSVESDGNLGGLAGADAKCQAAGAAGSVSGPKNKTWKALLSQNTGSVVNAKDRFVWTGPLYNMAGVVIVPNPASWPWAPQVVGGSKIDQTENGAASGSYAWTGSTINGVANAADCNAWGDGTNAFNGHAGETTFISSNTWIDSFNNQCNGTFFGLYCISQ